MEEYSLGDQKRKIETLQILISEHRRALELNSEKVQTYEIFRDDYISLKNRLKSLPDKLQYEALVPLGSKALVTGKLIHTNEILCHLGDSWYMECSAKKSTDIVDRRIKRLESMIDNLKRENELYQSWRKEVENQLEETANEQSREIVEVVDEKELEDWRKIHRENVKKYRQQLAKERSESGKVTEAQSKIVEESESEDAFWSRLDELEIEEELERAAEESLRMRERSIKEKEEKIGKILRNESLPITNPPENNNTPPDSENSSKVTKRAKKAVKFCEDSNLRHYALEENTDDTLKNSEKCDDDDKDDYFSKITIKFNHTPSNLIDQKKEDEEKGEINNDNDNNVSKESPLITSPGDILKVFGSQSQPQPNQNQNQPKPYKSILKAKSNYDNFENKVDTVPHDKNKISFSLSDNNKDYIDSDDDIDESVEVEEEKQSRDDSSSIVKPLKKTALDKVILTDNEISVKSKIVERIQLGGVSSDEPLKAKKERVSLFKQGKRKF